MDHFVKEYISFNLRLRSLLTEMMKNKGNKLLIYVKIYYM